MKTELVLKSANILDFQTFMLFYSPRARNQLLLNTLGIFGEAMIAGFVIDIFFKTYFFTIAGVVFGILWLIFYPKFLRKKRMDALNSLRQNSQNEKKMIFEVSENGLAFYDDAPQEDTKFGFDEVSEIYELKNIFAIFLRGKIHLIIPKEGEISQMISLISKNAKKHILKYENLEFASVCGK